MAPIQNARVIFGAVPKDFPIPGETTIYDTTETIDLDAVPLEGGILIKALALSVDPFLRGLMIEPGTDHYAAGYEIGKSIWGFGVGVIVRSEEPAYAPGKRVYGFPIQFQEYSVIAKPAAIGLRILERHPELPWTVYLGKTAYMAWKEFSNAKMGETAFITTGAGPVGSLVIQLAKQAGMKVIASAGSEEKVEFMKEIGADVAFNYKTTDTREVLKKAGPIDVYWDNVGGDILDAALEYAAIKARFLECGMISGYNTGPQGIKNLGQLIGKSISMHGIVVSRLQPKYDEEFYATVPAKIVTEEIKYREEVSRGLDKVGDIMLSVQKGTNKAKAVIIVANE
ncbi:hypothetical protein C8J57DRAFT_1613372 [Mycena rebaudengoi]|nr:hypothetical protein C8J57DRAFT_1613372 [Mycena rebaudengoi]